MSIITRAIRRCDRCDKQAEVRSIDDKPGWLKIAVEGSRNRPASIGLSPGDAHMCPECAELFDDWWLRKAEFPPVETKIVSRVRAALGLDEITAIKREVTDLVIANVRSAYTLAALRPQLFADGSMPEIPAGTIQDEAFALISAIVERHGLAKDGEA